MPETVVRTTLDGIVASAIFRRSPRHRDFLAHVVGAALERRDDQSQEVVLEIEVFGRSLPAHDPQREPVVRVEAGRCTY